MKWGILQALTSFPFGKNSSEEDLQPSENHKKHHELKKQLCGIGNVLSDIIDQNKND